MRTINNVWIILFFSLFIVFHSAEVCAKPTQSKAMVVLFDISESTSQQQKGVDNRTSRERYFNDFKKLLKQMKESDVLKGGAITGQSGSEGFVISADFPSYSFLSNKEKIKEEMDKIGLRALKQARNVLQKTAPMTDIFGAMRQSSNVFRQYPGYHHILVIFSDMVQESQEYKMDRNGPQSGEASRLIDLWKQMGGMPQLEGVDIYVWGASYPDERTRLRIENFWKDLFSAMGARLQEYAPNMIRFGEYQ